MSDEPQGKLRGELGFVLEPPKLRAPWEAKG